MHRFCLFSFRCAVTVRKTRKSAGAANWSVMSTGFLTAKRSVVGYIQVRTDRRERDSSVRRLPSKSHRPVDKLFQSRTCPQQKPRNTHPGQKELAMVSRFFRQAGDSDSDTESSDEESLVSGDEAPKPAAPAKPKSRFLRSGGSTDSESSSEEEESDSSEEEQKQTSTAPKVSKYLAAGSDDEDSDEEVKRVVKSAKDKRLDEMEATGTAMNNALKINDWTAISAGELGFSTVFAVEE
jgi:hypothetical protein